MAQAVDELPVRAGTPLPLRVGFVGPTGRDWLGAWVDALELPGDGREADALGSLDAVVVDPDPAGLAREEATRIVTRARDAGARVIGLAPVAAAGTPVWDGLADLTPGGPGPGSLDESRVRPVDLRSFNPIGYRHTDVAGLAAVATATGGDPGPAGALLARAASEEPVALFLPRGESASVPAGVLTVSQPRGGERRLYTTLKERLGALDHPSFHATDEDRAAHLVRLCASGVPVVCAELSDVLARMLGDELAGALEGVAVEDLLDLDLRERVSIAQRRAALRNHSLDARWRQLAAAASISVPQRPNVSVILSTRRQEWLSFGLSQVARQNYEPRELVVCLHGDDFSDDVEERLRAEVEGPLTVVRVASELTLGDALNQGVEAASGELVTKMDDDDYYSVDHLWDLVLASEYSGADLVGKAAEFVYLEDIDLTLRRFMGDTEGDAHPRLAGGGMMARRAPLRELGGWPSRSRGEDTVLIKTFRQAGRKVHRTHGYGYILNRHGRDHTWNTYVDYFLVQSEREWRGLRFDETGIY